MQSLEWAQQTFRMFSTPPRPFFKRYAVQDDWGGWRYFWTWTGACKSTKDYSLLRIWRDGRWQKPKF